MDPDVPFGLYGGVGACALDGAHTLWQAGDSRIQARSLVGAHAGHTLNSGLGAFPFLREEAGLVFAADGSRRVAYWRLRQLLPARPLRNDALQRLSGAGVGHGGFLDHRARYGWDEARCSFAAFPAALDGSPGQDPSGHAACEAGVSTLAEAHCGHACMAYAWDSAPQQRHAFSLLDLERGRLARRLVGHLGAVTGVHSAQGFPQCALSSSLDGTAKLWDHRGGWGAALTLDGAGRPLNRALLLDAGGGVPLVATGGASDVLLLWDMRRPRSALYAAATGNAWVNDLCWEQATATLYAAAEHVGRDAASAHRYFPSAALERRDFEFDLGQNCIIGYQF